MIESKMSRSCKKTLTRQARRDTINVTKKETPKRREKNEKFSL